ncbi:MAG: phenylalanine 4-monooxygenase [Proteobacteria bacterium]|nr:MAG: phenylalanine 4-monooxygenase [Pseudomonadota bacterium]
MSYAEIKTSGRVIPPGLQECVPDYRDIHTVAVPQYTDEQHGTWALLIENQQKVLPNRACNEFLEGLSKIPFPRDRIPALSFVSDAIEKETGWSLMRVDGLVPDKEFCHLLSAKIFPSTDFIRERSEIGYTPAPDMFHDLLGHVPLLTNPRFTAFFEKYGRAGVKAFETDHPATKMLPRIYWYTVEFGLIRNPEGLRIFGSGIVSSPNEVLYSLSEKTVKHPFDIDVIAGKTYDIWRMQEELFVIESFDQLEFEFDRWAKAQGLL